VSKTVGEKGPNNECDTVHSVPVTRSKSLFGTAPPHRCGRNTRRSYHGFEGTQYESHTEKAFEISTGGHDGQAATPEEDSRSDDLSSGQFDEDECGERLHD
jgi:hypothetical protein